MSFPTNTLSSRRQLMAAGCGLAVAGLCTDVRAAASTCGGMTRAEFDDYIARFNGNDPSFVDFYHPDVVLELGNTSIVSAAGIADFYAEVKQHIREFLEVNWFIADENGVAVEMTTTFSCFNDWQDSFWNRPLKEGEVMRGAGFVHYAMEDGLFRHIKSARYKVINDWRMEADSGEANA